MSSSSKPTIGFICGSLRTGSVNQQLSKAIQNIAAEKGADVKEIDLGHYDLPLYHGDLDAPKQVFDLIEDVKACDGVVVVTPEYNGSLPALLKNAIDWTSLQETGHIKGPVYGIASCTPGPMSGIMAMRELQFILMRLGADLVPMQVGCGNAAAAFDDDGKLVAGRPADFADIMLTQMLDRISAGRGA